MFWQEEYLKKQRKKWLESLKEVQYLEDGVWKIATVNSKAVEGTDLVIMANAPSSGSRGTITAARIYDADGMLAASEVVNIEHTRAQNTLFRFVLPIKEGN